MSRDIDSIAREIIKTNKELHQVDDKLSKDNNDIKKILKNLEKKIDLVLRKIQEFEIVMDAAEIIEEHMDDENEKYNTEWNPYDDEDYNAEDYEGYDDNDDDEEDE
jgi:hypothetical protein